MDVSQALEEFIVQNIMVADGDVSLSWEDSLIASGIVDSLGILRLVAFIEEKFSVVVDDTEVVPENFETINAMSSLVQRKQSKS
ncbi:MAG: acyl carrier protein [Anaerolineales bacterium]